MNTSYGSKMPIAIKRMLVQKVKSRYSEGSEHQKSLMLDEFCATTDLSRKYAIRILNGELKPRRKTPGPKHKYDSDLQHHLLILWESCGRLCSKKMVKAIERWLPYYEGASDETRKLLTQISSSTIDRILRSHRELIEKGQSMTCPSRLTSKIPIKLLELPTVEPGFMEADTVAHCGTSMSGEFINTLTVTDLFSGWTELRAMWGKRSGVVLDATKSIENSLPFKIKGFASDNGCEFLNDILWEYFNNRENKVEFMRRRPYKKNDNAHVEQKNWTHVRRLLGYDRLDQERDLAIINDLYENYWLVLWNFFTPVMKLKSKTQINGRVVKVHDEPRTPYERLLESGYLSLTERKALILRAEHFNPFQLRAELNAKLRGYFKTIDIRNRQSISSLSYGVMNEAVGEKIETVPWKRAYKDEPALSLKTLELTD